MLAIVVVIAVEDVLVTVVVVEVKEDADVSCRKNNYINESTKSSGV